MRKPRTIRASILLLAVALMCAAALAWHTLARTPAVRLGPNIRLQTGRVVNIAGWIIYNVPLWPKARFYIVHNPRNAQGGCVNGVNVVYPPSGYGVMSQDIAFNPSLCLSLWEDVRK